jgi:hypothetical protein
VFPFGNGIYHGETLLGCIHRDAGEIVAETAAGEFVGNFDSVREAISAMISMAKRKDFAEALR